MKAMRALFCVGFAVVVLAASGLEGGAFNCLQALVVGAIGTAAAFYGFYHGDLRA